MSDHGGAPAGRGVSEQAGEDASQDAAQTAGETAGERAHREGVAARLAHQWAAMRRHEREPEPVEIAAGTSNFNRAEVPYGVDLAAAWSWRLLVIAAAAALIGYLISFFAVMVIPVVVALLISALVVPLVDRLERAGVRRSVAAILVVLLTITSVGALLTFAGQQVANGASDLADQTVAGLQEIKDWLRDGPLHASDSQINDYIKRLQDAITKQSGEGGVISSVTEVGTAVGHILAGFFIVLFSTYFFLSDGNRIWAWVVRLSPPRGPRAGGQLGPGCVDLADPVRAGHRDRGGHRRDPDRDRRGGAERAVLAGHRRAGVPRRVRADRRCHRGRHRRGPGRAGRPGAGAGADHARGGHRRAAARGPRGPQPFLMGRWVSVHPLGVILAIAAGVLTAGVAGALVAVPLAAAVNAVVQHLAGLHPRSATTRSRNWPRTTWRPGRALIARGGRTGAAPPTPTTPRTVSSVG